MDDGWSPPPDPRFRRQHLTELRGVDDCPSHGRLFYSQELREAGDVVLFIEVRDERGAMLGVLTLPAITTLDNRDRVRVHGERLGVVTRDELIFGREFR